MGKQQFLDLNSVSILVMLLKEYIASNKVLSFSSKNSFPSVGVINTVYIDETNNSLYFWNAGEYHCVGISKEDINDLIGNAVKVTGIKGEAESTYRTGNVNITKANLGLGNLSNTADNAKNVASASKLTTARKITLTNGVTGTVNTDFSGDVVIDTNVLWDSVSGKPSTYMPSAHTHTKTQISDFPSSLPNPNALDISFNGTSQGVYDGNTKKSIDITPANIGAALSNHGTHVSYGTNAPSAAGAASVGTASTVSRSDHVHPLQTTISGNAGSATKANQDAAGNDIASSYAASAALSGTNLLLKSKSGATLSTVSLSNVGSGGTIYNNTEPGNPSINTIWI